MWRFITPAIAGTAVVVGLCTTLQSLAATAPASLPLNYITPATFGAKCDGTTDDAKGLQASEVAAYRAGVAVVYPAGSLCKTTIPIVPGIGVDHYCLTGMNYGDSIGGKSNRCGVFGAVDNRYAFELEMPNGTEQIQSPTWHDMYITSTGGCIRLNNPAHGFTDDNKSQQYLMYPRADRVNCTGHTIGIQWSKTFYGSITDGQFNAGISIDIEGSDIINVNHNNLLGATDLNLKFVSHGTFGNANHAENNFVACPYAGDHGIACVYSSARSFFFRGNSVECQNIYAKLPRVIQVDTGALQAFIDNNVIDCGPKFAAHGLEVNTNLYLMSFTNNSSSGFPYASALWNKGSGAQLYVNPTNLQQIWHSGNSSEGGFPYSSFTNFPEYWDRTPGLLAVYQPGGSGYNASSSDYGARVSVAGGAYILPAARGEGNILNFNEHAKDFVGPLEICVLAAGTSAPHRFAVRYLDGGSVIHANAFQATPFKKWFCYKGNFGAGATVQVVNNDVQNNAVVQLYSVTIAQDR